MEQPATVKFHFQYCECKVTHLEAQQLQKAPIHQAGPYTLLTAASWFTDPKGTGRLLSLLLIQADSPKMGGWKGGLLGFISSFCMNKCQTSSPAAH